MRILLASLLLLTGCATQSAIPATKAGDVLGAYSRLESQYPLTTDHVRGIISGLARKLDGVDDTAIDCMTASYLGDISDSDLSVVEGAMASHYLSPEYLLIASRLFGPSVLHGNAISAAKYKDGTARDFEAEHVVDVRAQGVARKLCPAILAKYPQAFGY